MRKTLILVPLLLLAAGCGTKAPSSSTTKTSNPSPQVKTMTKPIDTTGWEVFATDPKISYGSEVKVTFAKNGFSLKHPANWPVDIHDNPRAVLSIANSDKAPGQIPSAIYIFPATYVEFSGMDEIARANHPGSEAVDIPGLDAFKFNDTTEAHNPSYHINYPDKSGGFDVVFYPNLASNSTEQYVVFEEIVKTINFKK